MEDYQRLWPMLKWFTRWATIMYRTYSKIVCQVENGFVRFHCKFTRNEVLSVVDKKKLNKFQFYYFRQQLPSPIKLVFNFLFYPKIIYKNVGILSCLHFFLNEKVIKSVAENHINNSWRTIIFFYLLFNSQLIKQKERNKFLMRSKANESKLFLYELNPLAVDENI